MFSSGTALDESGERGYSTLLLELTGYIKKDFVRVKVLKRLDSCLEIAAVAAILTSRSGEGCGFCGPGYQVRVRSTHKALKCV